MYEAVYTRAASASDQAYGEIKSWILMGGIPVGARLREERIAERLSMSRTPVREAMLRLYGERFLERQSDGGFRIAHLTLGSLRDFYEVRRALETFAVRQTAAGCSPEARTALEDLREEWLALLPEAPETDPEFVLPDEDFHRRLAMASGNALLAEELRNIGERIRPVRTHDFVTPGRVRTTITQHLEILDAVIAGDARAEKLLDAHILESQAYVEAGLGRAMERMLTVGEQGLAW
jgi:DNA-binding GntR family transcriptional regulator